MESVDKIHASGLTSWKEMGAPEPPDRDQTKILCQAAFNTAKSLITIGSDGIFEYDTVLTPWSLILIKEE